MSPRWPISRPRAARGPRTPEPLANAGRRMVTLGRDLADRVGILSLLEFQRGLRIDRRGASRADVIVPVVLKNLAGSFGHEVPGTTRPQHVIRASSDLTILATGVPGQPAQMIIKIAESSGAERLLELERRTLTTLHDDARLGAWRALLPNVIGSGEVDGIRYTAEDALPGTSLEHLLLAGADPAPGLRAAAETIGIMHRATAAEQVIGDEILDRWVVRPAALIAELVGAPRGRRSLLTAVGRLSDHLCRELGGLPVTLGWVHGDYHAGNVLVRPDGQVSGILDWDLAHPQDLPGLDIATLLMTARMRLGRQDLGRVVCEVIRDDGWASWERDLIGTAHKLPASASPGTESVVLLCWLRHIALTMDKHRRYVDRTVWVRSNIETVLQGLADTWAPPTRAGSYGPPPGPRAGLLSDVTASPRTDGNRSNPTQLSLALAPVGATVRPAWPVISSGARCVPVAPAPLDRARAGWRKRRFGDKLTVNAISLIVTTVATNLLGLLFWGIAARIHTPAAVGAAYAELAALVLLSSISQLNLTNIFVRFLPNAGRFTTQFVRRAYAAVVILSLAAGIVFVASGLATSVVGRDLFDHVLFVVSVALFAVFALQDSVMIALRITHWVPIENITCALAKLALLPILVIGAARTGIIVAWVVPVIVAVLIVNGALFSRGMRTRSASGAGEVPSPRKLASFVTAEYLTSLCGLLIAQLMPLLVVWKLGVKANAYFVIPWLANTALSVVLWNVGVSFVVEVVTASENSAKLLRRSMQLWATVVVGALVGCVLLGPLVLPIVGREYARHGVALLRLVGLTAPLLLVSMLYQSFAWLDQRVWWLLAVQVLSLAMFFILTFILIPRLGLVGVGWALLTSRLVAALLMIRPVLLRISAIGWRHAATNP